MNAAVNAATQAIGIGSVLRQLYRTITVYLGALEKTALIVDNLATVGVETSGAYVDESRISRAKQLKLLEAEMVEDVSGQKKLK